MIRPDPESYWENRYKRHGVEWGFKPSLTARKSLEVLKKIGRLDTLIDVGCGYGRDSFFFSYNGYEVVGIDASKRAIEIANKPEGAKFERCSPPTFVRTDIFDYVSPQKFDVVYSNFFVHLFDEGKRQEIIKIFADLLRDHGVILCSVASSNDSDFGQGESAGPDSCINERGVKKTYYDEVLLKKEFSIFEHLRFLELEEEHWHNTHHKHILKFIIATNSDKIDLNRIQDLVRI